MAVIVQDNSIGQALGQLGSALLGDPKGAWEAEAYKQKIASMQADTAKAQLETLNLQRQQDAQQALIGQFGTIFSPNNFNVPQTIEAPRPATPGFQGPMPGVHNPEADTLDAKLNFARTAAANAIMRGGNPTDALSASYAALGQGGILMNGLPQTEQAAREAQVMLTGQIPDANTPLSEEQRLVMQTEKDLMKLKEAVPVAKDGLTYLSPAQGATMGIQPNDQGQYILRGPTDAPDAPGMLGGTALEAQAANALFEYQRAVQNRQPVAPDMLMKAQWAWNTLYGPKKEQRAVPGGGVEEYTVYPSVPRGFVEPTAGAPVSAPAMQPRGPQAAWGPQVPAAGGVVAPQQPGVQVPQMQQPGMQVPQQPGQPAIGGQTSVATLKQAREEAPQEHVIKKATFTKTMNDSLRAMKKMLAEGYKPTGYNEFLRLAAPSGPNSTGATNALLKMAYNAARDPKANQFDQIAYTFVNAVLRDESGAAVPEEELARYVFTLVPTYNDGPEQVQAKLQRMQDLIDARVQALSYNSYMEMMRQLRDQDAIAAVLGPSAAQPQAGGAPAAQPQPGSPDLVKERESATSAITAIQNSSLPNTEKARRVEEAKRRFQQNTGSAF